MASFRSDAAMATNAAYGAFDESTRKVTDAVPLKLLDEFSGKLEKPPCRNVFHTG